MNFTAAEIEEIEYRYLLEIEWCLTHEQDKLLKLLETKNQIKSDWIDKFDRIDKRQQTGEMARGSERVFATLFPNTWLPNTSPIGSDLMFETIDAIVHIDIKTSKFENPADHSGKVPIGQNQTSYFDHSAEFTGNLPNVYTFERSDSEEKKVCVTYVIQVVYFEDSQKILCVVLVCIPNGDLYIVYGDEVMDRGKTKGTSARYRYGDQYFKKLIDTPNRFVTVYENSNFMDSVNEVITLKR